MAGYSGTPLPKKLGIKEGHTVATLNESEGFGATLGPLPAGTDLVHDGRGHRDVVAYKVCAIDDVWSGLRLVVRVENRGTRR